MIWTSLFIINISQGLFLIPMILIKGSGNKTAARLISSMLAIIIITNFGYMVIRTEFITVIPKIYLLQFGMILLFGPLFYIYVKSVTNDAFEWKPAYWLHFLPYVIQVVYNIRFINIDDKYVIEFIKTFLNGGLKTDKTAMYIFALQLMHLFIYLFFTLRSVKIIRKNEVIKSYLIPLSARVKWLGVLFALLLFFAVTFLGLYLYILIAGYYNPVTNYIYTILTSIIIYSIAYKLVFNRDLIAPGFSMKYSAVKPIDEEITDKYSEKLTSLMEKDKIYLDTDLKLSILADKLGLPSYRLSRLINEKYGKSFNDFVNEYRVKEFISRLNTSGSESFTIYAIALDSGFNSKSSFNAAFKKITGKNPSEYKPGQ